MTDSTLPKGNFKPTKVLPKSYSRPVIDLGGGTKKKREWRYVTALDIRAGDIIADLGVVHEDPEYVRVDDPYEIRVRMRVGENGPLTFDSTTLMKAFT